MEKKRNILTVRDIAVSYGNIQAIKKVDLEINDNEFIVLLGSNGAGKTTLLNAILGTIHPKRGSIVFLDKDITRWNTENIVSLGISVVPEGRGVLPLMSVIENLELGAYHVKHGIGENLKRIFTLFPILEQRKHQQAGTLSGGEQQMLAIGRALMSSPKLLLMDEPSLGLSPVVINQMYEIIVDLHNKGQTILLAEQNARRALKVADRGYVLDLGTVVLSDTCQQLSSNTDVRKVYLGIN